jgi:predicted esterase
MSSAIVLEQKAAFVACAALLLTCSACPNFPGWGVHLGQHEPPPGAAAGHAPPPPAAGSGGSSGDPTTPLLPQSSAACPKLATGVVSIAGAKVQLWVGAKAPNRHGPLIVYWYGTGSSPQEVELMLPAPRDEVVAQGGLVATLVSSTAKGETTGADTWYTGDFSVVDQIVACAVQQLDIDVRRIYTAGCSYGAVQAGALAYARSTYIAAAMLNSGGLVTPRPLQDAARVPAVITGHGADSTDVVIVNFADASIAYDKDLVARGGFAVDCNHGGGHCGAPRELAAAQWEFLKAHPFGVAPEPYAGGLPASFPSYCKIVN